MDLIAIIGGHNHPSIEERLEKYMSSIPKPQRLERIQELLVAASETDELVAEIASKAWSYLESHQLWESKYRSLEAFKEAINYESTVNDILKRKDILDARQLGEARCILANWGRLPHDALPPELHPPRFTTDMLRLLNRLSKICPLGQAISMLKDHVQQRLSLSVVGTKGARNSRAPHILPGDVMKIWEQVISLTDLEQSQGPQAAPPPEVPDCNHEGAEEEEEVEIEGEEEAKDNGGEESERESDTKALSINKMNTSSLELERARKARFNSLSDEDVQHSLELGSRPTLDEPCSETQSRVTRSVLRLKRTAYELNDNDDNDDNEDDENDQVGQDTASPKLARKKPRPDDCSCPVGARKLVGSFVVSPQAPQQGTALANLQETAPFESLCRSHLRLFAGNALDMVTNITTAALLERLEWIYRRKQQMINVRRVRPSWFRGQSGDVWRETPPVFVKGERENFDFDAGQVFNRFAGQGSWDRWLQDGTLILPGIFDHLRQVQAEIHSEFEMYAFHLGKQPGLPTMGWMRNMYHSGPQQLMYQDPVLWALTAAARTDKHWRLIAYPYNAKNAAAGQKTGFLHLDLDLKRHQNEGLGINMVQSSVSLTDENDKGCTLVVPGFHKHFQEWVRTRWDMIDSRVSSRSTTDMKGMYTAEDRVRFGRPVPAPCPAWGIRLSRSDIIHGSSDEGTQLRRVMSPWFTAINEDHKTMENPDCMNWEELSRCHKDLVGPSKESLGDQPRKGVAGVRFPGAIPVRSAYSVPQALVGLKEWTEPDVIFERNILLGPDDNQALELAENIRNQLVDTYKYLYPLMEFRERQAFGNRSSFAENNVAQDGDEDIGLEEDSE